MPLQSPSFSSGLTVSDIDRGIIEVVPSMGIMITTGMIVYNNLVSPSLDAATPIITIMDEFQEPQNIDAVVALFSLSSTQPDSRLVGSQVTLEIISELFSFQGSTEVTVSAVLQNGRRIVIDSPPEIQLESSNSSIVSVRDNFVEAVATGDVELTVSWVVCGMVLGTDVISISATFDQHVPEFEPNTQSASILEDANVGTSITAVFAEDEDYSSSVPVALRDTEYSFADASSSYNGLFVLNKATGVISLNGPLDHESVTSYELVIEATDRSQRRLLQQLLNFQTSENPGGTDNVGSGIANSGSGSGSGDMITPVTAIPLPTSAPAPPRPSISTITVRL